MTGRLIPPCLLLLLAGCPHRWLPVAHGMNDKTVLCELRTEDDDFNSKAPKGFTPAKDNRFVVFIYDPQLAPKVHQAFLKITDDCFMYQLPSEKDGEPRHSAICAHERTPPPPEDYEY